MSYVVDEDLVNSLDAEMRDPSKPLGGGTGRIVDFREVNRWLTEATKAQETALVKLDDLAREVGWSAIVEALRTKGVLHDDRFDGWWG